MKIDRPIPLISKDFSTNGVLRCISGHLPSGKTEKDISDTLDILSVVQRVFNYSDKEFTDILQNNNPFGAYLTTVGAGKKLLANNASLANLLKRLEAAECNNKINEELDNIISEVGENINLKV